ncbi:hypothetical protein [Planctobacterium marinum]|uniref:hypothetical protein n=1 Tax=Planctobacterium marinum TaxID=1631968 RepID=UPI001E508EAA|nr:hypothetical protein [Planctobacterium marinum]MCC2606145.1 hypothetical protein [Planctobacterium marinum]
MRYLVLTETPYQQSVAKGCSELENYQNIHWNIRGQLEGSTQTESVNNRVSFLLYSIFALFKSDALVLGDFRSFIQLCVLSCANLIGKRVFIAEDGIINLVADDYNYDVKYLDDGGMTSFKKMVLRYFVKNLQKAGRITTEPAFVRARRPDIQLFTSRLSPESFEPSFLVERRKLVFVGQHLASMGVKKDTQVMVLKSLQCKLSDRYDEFCFSPHPRSDDNTQDVVDIGWSISGALSKLSSDVIDFDLVGFHSTAMLDHRYRKVHKYVVPLEGKLVDIKGRMDGQLRAQETLIKVFQASETTFTVLDI